MIIRTPGDWTDNLWCYAEDDVRDYAQTIVYETRPSRTSSVLGSDGLPLQVIEARRPFGFDLTPRKEV